MAQPARWRRASIPNRSVVVAGVAAIAIALFFGKCVACPRRAISRTLSLQNPDAYTLSLGHMGDLTLESFAYLRMPLVVGRRSPS